MFKTLQKTIYPFVGYTGLEIKPVNFTSYESRHLLREIPEIALI